MQRNHLLTLVVLFITGVWAQEPIDSDADAAETTSVTDGYGTDQPRNGGEERVSAPFINADSVEHSIGATIGLDWMRGRGIADFMGLFLELRYNGYLRVNKFMAVGFGVGLDYISAVDDVTHYDAVGGYEYSLSSVLLSFNPLCRFGSRIKYLEASLDISIPLSSSIYFKRVGMDKKGLETDPKTGVILGVEGRYKIIGGGVFHNMTGNGYARGNNDIFLSFFIPVKAVEVVPKIGVYTYHRFSNETSEWLDVILSVGVNYLF